MATIIEQVLIPTLLLGAVAALPWLAVREAVTRRQPHPPTAVDWAACLRAAALSAGFGCYWHGMWVARAMDRRAAATSPEGM